MPFVRRYLLFILFLFLCFSSFSLSGEPGLEKDIFNQTNDFRGSNGLSLLIYSEDLGEIARKHSADMASGRTAFGHNGFDDRETRIKTIITPYHGMAENVAFGACSAKEVVGIWKKSPGHRRNMLGPYKYIGIGTARDRKGQIFFTEIFVR
jgi:uncharacterized protein YkwD